jgi:hypothetical protein
MGASKADPRAGAKEPRGRRGRGADIDGAGVEEPGTKALRGRVVAARRCGRRRGEAARAADVEKPHGCEDGSADVEDPHGDDVATGCWKSRTGTTQKMTRQQPAWMMDSQGKIMDRG